MDMQNPGFISYITKQIKKHGAQGGYIAGYQYKRMELFRAGVYDQKQDYTPTGNVETDNKTIKIILFNFKNAQDHDCNQ